MSLLNTRSEDLKWLGNSVWRLISSKKNCFVWHIRLAMVHQKFCWIDLQINILSSLLQSIESTRKNFKKVINNYYCFIFFRIFSYLWQSVSNSSTPPHIASTTFHLKRRKKINQVPLSWNRIKTRLV